MAFARRAGFRDVVDLIVAQQRFILCMQGRTGSVATFGDSEFDEAAFEEALTPDRMVTMVFWYWVLKGQARSSPASTARRRARSTAPGR